MIESPRFNAQQLQSRPPTDRCSSAVIVELDSQAGTGIQTKRPVRERREGGWLLPPALPPRPALQSQADRSGVVLRQPQADHDTGSIFGLALIEDRPAR